MFDHAVDLPFGSRGLKSTRYRRERNRKMKDCFRWSTVIKAWDYTKPYLIRMTGEMAADYADRVRRPAS